MLHIRHTLMSTPGLSAKVGEISQEWICALGAGRRCVVVRDRGSVPGDCCAQQAVCIHQGSCFGEMWWQCLCLVSKMTDKHWCQALQDWFYM